MRAIILAAGRGSRLCKLTADKPKCMVPIFGKPLIWWQVRALRGAGIKKIGIVCGYRAEQIRLPGVSLFSNPQWEKTNMVSSLLCARNWLQNDTCIISYADIVYPVSTARTLRARRGDIVLPYNTAWEELWRKRFANPLEDVETFRVRSNGILADIGGQARSLAEIKGQYMGLLKFTPNGWGIIEAYLNGLTDREIAVLDMTSLLRALCARGVCIATFPVAGKWLEVDSVKDISLYEKDIPLTKWMAK